MYEQTKLTSKSMKNKIKLCDIKERKKMKVYIYIQQKILLERKIDEQNKDKIGKKREKNIRKMLRLEKTKKDEKRWL